MLISRSAPFIHHYASAYLRLGILAEGSGDADLQRFRDLKAALKAPQ